MHDPHPSALFSVIGDTAKPGVVQPRMRDDEFAGHIRGDHRCGSDLAAKRCIMMPGWLSLAVGLRSDSLERADSCGHSSF